VERNRLQLMGAAALLLASKMEEVGSAAPSLCPLSAFALAVTLALLCVCVCVCVCVCANRSAVCFLNARWHQIYPPQLDDMIFVCMGLYNRVDFYEAERDIFVMVPEVLKAPHVARHTTLTAMPAGGLLVLCFLFCPGAS
jgi:hypothetical protein